MDPFDAVLDGKLHFAQPSIIKLDHAKSAELLKTRGPSFMIQSSANPKQKYLMVNFDLYSAAYQSSYAHHYQKAMEVYMKNNPPPLIPAVSCSSSKSYNSSKSCISPKSYSSKSSKSDDIDRGSIIHNESASSSKLNPNVEEFAAFKADKIRCKICGSCYSKEHGRCPECQGLSRMIQCKNCGLLVNRSSEKCIACFHKIL